MRCDPSGDHATGKPGRSATAEGRPGVGVAAGVPGVGVGPLPGVFLGPPPEDGCSTGDPLGVATAEGAAETLAVGCGKGDALCVGVSIATGDALRLAAGCCIGRS